MQTAPARPIGILGRRLSHRALLKLLAAALGGAGAAQVATGARPVGASYIPGPPDVVDTNLTVQGNLVVTAPNRMGIGTQTPQGALDVAGEIRTNGLVTILSNGVGKHSFYDSGPATSPPPAFASGTWGWTRASTWGALGARTWGDVGTVKGTWQRVGVYTWGQLAANTWAQVQDL